MKKNINVICPNYLSYDTLPYAADILYHGELMYFMPTGISPQEWENVIEFPHYCMQNNILLPKIIWEMQEKYFECSRQAVQCCEILEPFGKRILKAATVYSRDIAAITSAREMLKQNSKLLDAFIISEEDLKFLARELFSHVFLEVYYEKGYKAIGEYLKENSGTPEEFLELMVAVILNRLRSVFQSEELNWIIYNHNWYSFVLESLDYDDGVEDSSDLDPKVHRLFTEIITPILGRCNSSEKCEYVEAIIESQPEVISELKGVCKEIVEMSAFYVNDKLDLRDKMLKDMLVEKIIDPLSNMISKPRKEVGQLLKDFMLDSTVVGGLLSVPQGFDANTLGISIAAGVTSAGLKYLINKDRSKMVKPEELLVQEIKRNRVDYLKYEKMLRQISYSKIDI